jgi:hypothetical protein
LISLYAGLLIATYLLIISNIEVKMKNIIIFVFILVLLPVAGCSAEAWQRARDAGARAWDRAQEEARYSRSPLHSSYTERLSAERFCENRFKQDGYAGDYRDFVAYKYLNKINLVF